MTIPKHERAVGDGGRRTPRVAQATAKPPDPAFGQRRRRSIEAVLQRLRRDSERRAAR
jgi:hypothetical protein